MYDQDDIYILELAIDDPLKDNRSARQQQLRSATIDSLVSRELKEERELTGYGKVRAKVNDLALSVGVASGVSGLVGYLHDQNVSEYAVKGGFVAVTSAALLYGLGKAIKYFKPSPVKTDGEKRAEKVKEYAGLLSSREIYQKSNHKVAIVGAFTGLFAIVSGVLFAVPYTVLAALSGIGAGTGLAAGTATMGVAAARILHSRKRKLDQYDIERARIVGEELFKK
ncbi:hypothetical protein HYT55_01210 [Candidatus Woesearchaeota archaeon]|nr:hypothetical protein [Candidatus Woesearchaeota archaeon]